MHAVLETMWPVSGLPAVEADIEIQKLAERRSFAPGECLFVEGGSDRGLWWLLSGQCEVVKGTNGHTERLAVLEPGEVCGEVSFVQPRLHWATVRALGTVEAAWLSTEAFESLRRTHPDIAHRLLTGLAEVLAERLRRTSERLCAMAVHAPEERRPEWDDFRARLFAGDFN